ncbi:MAG: hypothetical protein ABIQ27_13980 [Flavobacterium sp.]|uniref:hypothetical protein n=1 Tax=Flavobacterium sp. TaxID=239 RepID=UPI0032633147
MKNYTLLFIAGFSCFTGFAQKNNGITMVQPKSDVASNQEVAMVDTPTAKEKVKAITAVPEKKADFTKIKIIESYERVLEKGYKTEAMLQAVADYRYFADDFIIAAKWYTQLFEFCPDELAAVYYFRYAKSLQSSGEIEKAKEMMAIYQVKKI